MARYRKIDTRIWNDEKFRALSDDGKLVFFFLLTHPHMTSIGAMRATIPGLAAEIGWAPERLSEAFTDLLAAAIDRLGAECASCAARGDLVPDHVIPIAWGGLNEIANIQPLCRRCNCAKGSSLPIPPMGST